MIPSRVQVGCMSYRVETDVAAIREASAEADIDEGSEWTAFSDHDALVIGINPANPGDVQSRDLLHEILHCCMRYAGAEPNAYARVVHRAKEAHGGFGVEEYAVAALSGPLLSTLRQNPEVLAWLLAPVAD